ncbi:MAG TPA: phytanoyl-CoA dioxygenase family protein [Mycobacteriales bacterium]|nr:phytanoyl-CoA dioxygenase family protein [Mycobacteriales bacterium]
MLTDQQRADYDRDGFLVLPGVVDREQCARLVERAAQIAAEAPAEKSVFTTTEQERVSDERFLSSGPRVTCFTEPDGVTLAKIGHALHDLDPVFAEFSRQPAFAEVAGDVGLSAPLLLQSMYLCKAARSGGEVGSHQDATFLYTDPVTVTGLWVALEDATVDNGCLWALPGGHRTVPLEKRFVRLGGDADGTSFVPVADGPVAVPDDGWVPLEAETGTLVVLHGLLPHRSSPNTSPRSRAAYSLHLVEAGAHYPADNWLQRPADLPARGFDVPA